MQDNNLKSGKPIRTFLALELPEEFKQEISDIVGQLQKICPQGIKWVKPENFHITLQFIGNVHPSRIKDFTDEFRTILQRLYPFTISQPQVEVIPPGKPRLVWIKCDYDSPELKESLKLIRNYLKKNGFQIDKKPFRLHITLGRVKRIIPAREAVKLTRPEFSDEKWKVQEATFYKSRLHADGPEYTKIESYELGIDSSNL